MVHSSLPSGRIGFSLSGGLVDGSKPGGGSGSGELHEGSVTFPASLSGNAIDPANTYAVVRGE